MEVVFRPHRVPSVGDFVMRLPSGGEGYGSLAEVKTALGDMGVGGIQSTPPTGSFQIMNLYVDEVGRLVVEYEDGV